MICCISIKAATTIFEFGILSDYLSPLSFMHVKNSNFGAKKPLLVKILYKK